MDRNKYFQRWKISLFIALIAFIPFFLTFDVKPPDVNKKEYYNLSVKTPEYLLNPINTATLLVSAFVDYPIISKPPPQKGFFLFLQSMVEQNEVRQQKYDYLFLATKRIAELITWKNQLSFENQFSAYKKLIFRQLEFINNTVNPGRKLDRAITLNGRLLAHQQQIEELISTLEKDEEEKKILTDKTVLFFNSAHEKMKQLLPEYRSGYLVYPLAYPLIDREYGWYDGQLEIDGQSQGEIKKIYVDGTDDYLYWKTVDFPTISHKIEWIREKNSLNALVYSSAINLPQGGKWLIILSANLDQQTKISIVPDDESNRDPFYAESFNPNSSVKKYRIIDIDSNDKTQKKVKLMVEIYGQSPESYQRYLPSVSLSTQQLLNPEPPLLITKEIIQEKTPQLFLKKLSHNRYFINLTNTNYVKSYQISLNLGRFWRVNSDNVITFLPGIFFSRLFYLSLVIFVLLSLILLINKPIDSLLNRYYALTLRFGKKSLLLILSIINKFAVALRLPFLTLAILGIFSDIFVFQDSINLVVFAIGICWIVASIGYNLDSIVNFTMSFITFTIFFILLIFKQENLANRFSLWSTIFILMGIITVIIEINWSANKRWNFLNLLFAYAKDWTYGVFKIEILRKIVKKIVFFFKPKSLHLKDLLVSAMKLFLFFVIILSTVKFNKYLTNITNKINQIPVVYKSEPTIVYHSIKVIIRGNHFGSNENDNVKLMSNYGEIMTQLWTDNKIVFAVPLEWPTSLVDVWIERKFFHLGKEIQVKTKIQKFKVIPTSPFFTPDDELFFDQLIKLDEETKQINGY